jgi:hypothetical protein
VIGELELFAVLAVLALAEGLAWVPHGAVAFRTFLGRGGVALRASDWLGNARGGFVLGGAWPGTDLFTCELWPLAISPDAVAAAGAEVDVPLRSGSVVAVDGRRLRVDGHVVGRATSEELTRRLADLLRATCDAPPTERVALITAALAESLDVEAVASRVAACRRAARAPTVAATASSVHALVLAPLACWHYGLARAWPWLLVALLVLGAAVVVATARAARGLRSSGVPARPGLFVLALAPTSAMRARRYLLREVLAPFHPVAVAAVLCDREGFEAEARSALADARHPTDPSRETDVQRWFRERLDEALIACVDGRGVSPDDLLAAPAPEAAACVAYCPRCRCQYDRTEGTCGNCPGIGLLPLEGR